MNEINDNTKIKTAVFYGRYSSDKQTEQSIEGQLRACKEYADRNNIIIVDEYIDRAMTGKNYNRTAFQKMLKDSYKKAWNYVLVYRIDRFGRNKYEIAINKHTLKDNGVKVLSAMENIPDTPEGVILESLLEGMAEYYSIELAQKVRRGQNESRIKGQFTGGDMIYGYYVKDKKVYIEETEANFVRELFQRYLNGEFVKDIIDDFNNRGILNHGRLFRKTTVYSMLRNEKYIGILRHGDEIFKNIYPPILEEDIFNLVRTKIKGNAYGKHDLKDAYILKSKVFCGYCGHSIVAETGQSHTGKLFKYYKCLGRKQSKNCQNKTIQKELIEQLVYDSIINALNNKENLDRVIDKLCETNESENNTNLVIENLLREQTNISKSISNLIDCMEKGIVSNSTKQRLEDLERKLTNIETNIAIEKSKVKVQITKDDIKKYIFKALNQQKQSMIKILVNKIIVFNDKIDIYLNYTKQKNRPDDENRQAFSFYTTTYVEERTSTKFNKEKIKIKFDISVFF